MNRRLVLPMALTGALALTNAFGQQARMQKYEAELSNQIESKLQDYKEQVINEKSAELTKAARGRETRARAREGQRGEPEELQSLRQQNWKSTVDVYESNDGQGQDVEVRLTMPVDEFMEFAPIAALEAAAIPHKFPVVYIYVQEETTDRVGRVAFADAEPIAGRYLAGDKNAVREMNQALIWH